MGHYNIYKRWWELKLSVTTNNNIKSFKWKHLNFHSWLTTIKYCCIWITRWKNPHYYTENVLLCCDSWSTYKNMWNIIFRFNTNSKYSKQKNWNTLEIYSISSPINWLKHAFEWTKPNIFIFNNIDGVEISDIKIDIRNIVS